jgi:hypothetical protein
MRSKWTLFTGIFLLIAGIVIRKTTGFAIEGLVMIIVGVMLKTFYIISKARSGEYKPGKELLYLFAGLGLFLGGLYLRSSAGFTYAPVMIITGITLKIIFIMLFILKTRKKEIQ